MTHCAQDYSGILYSTMLQLRWSKFSQFQQYVTHVCVLHLSKAMMLRLMGPKNVFYVCQVLWIKASERRHRWPPGRAAAPARRRQAAHPLTQAGRTQCTGLRLGSLCPTGWGGDAGPSYELGKRAGSGWHKRDWHRYTLAHTDTHRHTEIHRHTQTLWHAVYDPMLCSTTQRGCFWLPKALLSVAIMPVGAMYQWWQSYTYRPCESTFTDLLEVHWLAAGFPRSSGQAGGLIVSPPVTASRRGWEWGRADQFGGWWQNAITDQGCRTCG